ncbi:MAG: regulator of protease activity HflC (stomatin/prohibitin superfamily) [Candidatus Paceibacteria bacterium]|jgi:regulator of protease activity HflC (stomatin/prohibitin superfamily)
MSLDLFGAITGLFVVVYDGQHGLKFTLGRAGNVVGPGVHFKWPIIQKYSLEETKHTTLNLEPQTIQLNDDLVYEVDCKVMYQIVDLRKSMIEIDDLVTGLENRVVMTVQRVVQAQDRVTVRDTEAMVHEIMKQLQPVEEQWGVRILQFGFSNFSPSPATLEITQLQLLAEERLGLYREFRSHNISPNASVALITGAVVATGDADDKLSIRERQEELSQASEEAADAIEEFGKESKANKLESEEASPEAEGAPDEEL